MNRLSFHRSILQSGRIAWGVTVECLLIFLSTSATTEASERPQVRVGFSQLAPAVTGLTFSNLVPVFRHLTNQMLLDGSGVAAGDVDGDGLPDLFLGSAGGRSALWHNLGNWRFEDVTGRAFPARSTALDGDVTGSAMADLNGDGAPDLVLNTHADGIRVLVNDGHGVFRLLAFPQASARGGHSLALADVDGDGWVDIYVCNYRRRALMDMPNARATFRREGGRTVVATIDGRPTTEPDLLGRFVVTASGGIEELGEPDVLYLNRGGTNFTEVPWTSGAFLDADGKSLEAAPPDWGLAAQFQDVNGDGRPDLYVCNDFQTPDRLWINESTPGKPRLRLVAAEALRHTSQFSMGVDFADINADGRPDFVVVDMLSPDPVRRLTQIDGTTSTAMDPSDPSARPQFDSNTLFLQRADGSFAEAAALAGVMATDWSWTPVFLDVDLDGAPDLLVSAGQERGSRDLDVAEQLKAFRRTGLRTDAQIFRERLRFPRLASPIRAFHNRGAAKAGDVPRFDDATSAWGFDGEAVSHGMALADLDGDGDLDLVVNRLGAAAGLYRNDVTAPRLSVRLRAIAPNSDAIGASLAFRWRRGGMDVVPPQTSQIIAGGRYLSGDEPRRTFACPGDGKGSLEVRWPSGRHESWTNLTAGSLLVLREGTGVPSASPANASQLERLRFEAVTTAAESVRPSLDEFAQQPGLPRRQRTRPPALLRTGLGILVGGDEVHPIRLLKPGGTVLVEGPGASRQTVGLALWKAGVIAAGSGPTPLFRLDPETLVVEPVPGGPPDPSCIAASLADAGDRSWVFVGGGPVAGAFPAASPSVLFQANGTNLTARPPLALGLVTGAAFADLDGDGRPELAVSTDWGAPRVLRLSDGAVEPWDPPVVFPGRAASALSGLTGWWQSVLVEDFDGDGRPDILLGNWGLNSAFALHSGPADASGAVRPLLLFPGPADQPGACLEAWTGADGIVRPVRGLTELGPLLPWRAERFPTHRAFAQASLPEILAGRTNTAPPLACSHLGSVILLNRGDHLEGRLLPGPVQLGPVMAMVSGDFDGDGRRDLYCAQGFFGHNFGVSRDDSGEGVFLLGRGDGTFDAVPSSETGVRLLGEQRSVIAIGPGADGRTGLAVGMHGGNVVLLRNRPPR